MSQALLRRNLMLFNMNGVKPMNNITLILLGMAVGAAVIGYGFSTSSVAGIAQVLFAAFSALLLIMLTLRFGSWFSDRQYRDRAR
jgi:uncharacterized membrane protein YtjA (UPF0391 family)